MSTYSTYQPSSTVLVQEKFAKTTPARQTITSATPVVITGLSIDFTPQFSDSIIEMYAVLVTTASHVTSYGFYKDGSPTCSTSGQTNNNQANMQVTTYGTGTTSTSNSSYLVLVPVYHYETAGNTTQRTYDIRSTQSWSGATYTVYFNDRTSDMASFSYMTIKEYRP